MRILFALIMAALWLRPVSAQTAPLEGPLLAINTVEQDAIILYDLSAGTYRELSFGLLNHHVWDFSPDGCELLLTMRSGTGPAQIYAASLDGETLRPLLDFSAAGAQRWSAFEPDWQPGGDWIAFTLEQGSGEDRETYIARVNAAGGAPEMISVTGKEASPVWSEDGQRLAYLSYFERVAGADVFSTAVPTLEPPPGQTPMPPVLLNEADMWVVSADLATKYRQTGFETGSVSMPRWSPDGEIIAFVWSPSGNNDTFWMIGSQDTARPSQLNYDWLSILDLTWLPDGTHIIGVARGMRDVSENRLWQIPLTDNADQTAFEYLSELNIASADFPRFSPNGDYLAVRSAYQLGIVDLAAQTITYLDERTFGNTAAVWSPAAFSGEANC